MRIVLIVFFLLFIIALWAFIYSNRENIARVFRRSDDIAENIIDVPLARLAIIIARCVMLLEGGATTIPETLDG